MQTITFTLNIRQLYCYRNKVDKHLSKAVIKTLFHLKIIISTTNFLKIQLKITSEIITRNGFLRKNIVMVSFFKIGLIIITNAKSPKFSESTHAWQYLQILFICVR